ncbi:Uncharacterized protein PECH_004354 [Penicillium ucsense]|uniref:Uncharacterized protein n=1 Tax=Penicillium ucsense TaxID=2839758 RepID=A0A8J8W413_9EURO|nr:Uncharacterized protein PECM_005308 [Penicillium ucsense]KAF7737047.1 Uncharacterized protein PECH_004354 [Penicillium ucsense]
MGLLKRQVILIGFGLAYIFVLTARQLSQSWSNDPRSLRLRDYNNLQSTFYNQSRASNATRYGSRRPYAPQPKFIPGSPKPPGSKYNRTLVVPRTKKEDTSWIHEELPDWDSAIYVVDDPKAPLHPPRNKGHEVMVYLSYIIDFYEELPDVAVFMHAHRKAWHNEDFFDGDAADILRRLSLERVIREGYMNTRCAFAPGCPAWIHPGAVNEDESKQEEVLLARAWEELFPDIPVPSVLSQPCCAQFALSRDRIRAIPRARFIFYRDWLLQTELSDYITGRIWEYLWQVVFTGEPVLCVEESVCLCDGYGFCFGGPEQYRAWRNLDAEREDLQRQFDDWVFMAEDYEVAKVEGLVDELEEMKTLPLAEEAEIEAQLAEKNKVVVDLFDAAVERGKDPKNRASEAGRPWKEGDGF